MDFLTKFSLRQAWGRNYNRSNAQTSIDFQVSSKAKKLSQELLSLSHKKHRKDFSQKLIDELSQNCGIPKAKLKISETKQWHKKKNGRLVFKQYGYYRSKSKYIYIQNRTAIQGKIVAPKTFLNTLLHEWLHHYDHQKLNLYSIHTKGFYQRLSSLKENLGM